MKDDCEAFELYERGYETATVELKLNTAFFALLEMEANERDTTVEELAERWLRLTWWDDFTTSRGGLSFNIEIGIPPDVYERAKLWSEATGNSLDETLFDILEFDPAWSVDGELVEPGR